MTLREETAIIMTITNTYNTIIKITTLRLGLIIIKNSNPKQIKFYHKFIETAIENKIIIDD